jgi:hypothetical protein
MPDFSHLKSLDMREGAEVEYEIAELPEKPVLTVRFMGESNTEWYQAVAKRSAGLIKKLRAAGQDARDEYRQMRDEDRELMPLHIVTGWPKPPHDADGNPVEYSLENCQAFLQWLPNWMFERMRNFCAIPENFVNYDAVGVTVEEAEGLGNT